MNSNFKYANNQVIGCLFYEEVVQSKDNTVLITLLIIICILKSAFTFENQISTLLGILFDVCPPFGIAFGDLYDFVVVLKGILNRFKK